MRDLNKDPKQKEHCWNLSSLLDPLSRARCSQEKLNTSDSPAQEHLGATGSTWENLGDYEVMDHIALLTEYKNLMTGAMNLRMHTGQEIDKKNDALKVQGYFQLCWLRFLATLHIALMSLRKSMQSSIHELDKYSTENEEIQAENEEIQAAQW